MQNFLLREFGEAQFDNLMAGSPSIIVTILLALTRRLINTTSQLHADKK